jgi:uncharacterized membrane protein YheB (UPF0754 family)
MIWDRYYECPNRSDGRKIAFYPYDKKECEQIKNIRWQSADPRHFTEGKNKNLLYSCMLTTIVNDLNKPLNVSTFLSEKNTFYARVMSTISWYRKNKNCFNKLKQTTFNAEDIYEEFIETGLVHKQLRFLNEPLKQTIKKYFKDYLDFVLNNSLQKYKVKKESLQQTHENIIKAMIEDENDGYISDQTLESLYNNYLYGYLIGYEIYLIDKYTCVLDIYTIARSLKPINNSYDVNPIINICYFGDTHVKNITYFFTQIMKGYDIILT